MAPLLVENRFLHVAQVALAYAGGVATAAWLIVLAVVPGAPADLIALARDPREDLTALGGAGPPERRSPEGPLRCRGRCRRRRCRWRPGTEPCCRRPSGAPR